MSIAKIKGIKSVRASVDTVKVFVKIGNGKIYSAQLNNAEREQILTAGKVKLNKSWVQVEASDVPKAKEPSEYQQAQARVAKAKAYHAQAAKVANAKKHKTQAAKVARVKAWKNGMQAAKRALEEPTTQIELV